MGRERSDVGRFYTTMTSPTRRWSGVWLAASWPIISSRGKRFGRMLCASGGAVPALGVVEACHSSLDQPRDGSIREGGPGGRGQSWAALGTAFPAFFGGSKEPEVWQRWQSPHKVHSKDSDRREPAAARADEDASRCNGVQTGCNGGRGDGQMLERGWPNSTGPAMGLQEWRPWGRDWAPGRPDRCRLYAPVSIRMRLPCPKMASDQQNNA